MKPQPEIVDAGSFRAHFQVSRETCERLTAYAAELARWQKTINLVAPSTIPHMWGRHFADSAQLVALAPPAARHWVDLGSGGGFPGLVAAILLAPAGTCRVTLIESDTRKASFLRTVARTVAVPVDILAERAEVAATRSNLAGVDVVSARALAPLRQLFDWIHPFTGPHTVMLLPKGRDVSAELQATEVKWNYDADMVPSITDSEARILIVRGLGPK